MATKLSFGLTNTVQNTHADFSPRITTVKVKGTASGRTYVKVVTGGANQMPVVQTCGAGERAFGVLDGDAVDGDTRSVWHESSGISVIAGAALAAGDNVQSDANGKAVKATTGFVTGQVRADTAAGAVAFPSLSL